MGAAPSRAVPNPYYAVPLPASRGNASAGCNKPLWSGLSAGGSTGSFSYTGPDGYTRNYGVHVPASYRTDHASPLIFAFPGYGATAADIESQTQFSTASVNPYGVAVYVTGIDDGFASNPNYGVPGAPDANVNDLSFMEQFIPYLADNFCIDTGRIWATGFSNGGGFVNVLACDPYASSVISVFTANSAAMYTNWTSGDPTTIDPVNTPIQSVCSPSRNNIAFAEVHGTGDGVIAYTGGPRRGKILPAIPHWLNEWVVRQGISTSGVSSPFGGTGSVGTGITRYQYGGGIITHYMINSWTHDWATASAAGMSSSQTFMDFFYIQTSTWGNGPGPYI